MNRIKVIAFDLIGVIARETDFKLSESYDRLERLFGKDMPDEEFIRCAAELVGSENIDKAIDYIVLNLYAPKNKDQLLRLKDVLPNIMFVLATNHVSNVSKFVDREFGGVFDRLFISADMHVNKPNKEYFEFILKKLDIAPEELLFIDDRKNNVEGAKSLGINTIHLTRELDLFDAVMEFLR